MPQTRTPGQILRDLRIEAGLTITQVAHAAEVAPSYLSRVENGTRVPSPRWVGRVAEAIAHQITESRPAGVA